MNLFQQCLFLAGILSLSAVSAGAQNLLNLFSISDSKYDELFVDVTWDQWLDAPANITLEEQKNRGVTITSVVDLGREDCRFSFAPGIAISNSNIFTDAVSWKFVEGGGVQSVYEEEFYRKNKVSLTYVEIPLEFRFRFKPRNDTWKIYLGARGGYLIDAHTKIKFEDGKILKNKERDNFYSWRYGAYVRLGYHHFHLYGYYALSPVFDHDDAPGTNMFSIGISFSAL